MAVVRKSIALIVAAALVWLSSAGGIISASTMGSQFAVHSYQNAQFESPKQPGAHAHHALADHPASHHAAPAGHLDAEDFDHRDDRTCAAACLDNIAAKLLPPSYLVKAPDAPNVVILPGSSEWAAAPLSFTPAYWPAAPPDGWASASTGAARVLARHSHLRT